MKTITTNAESLLKRTEESPWRISLLSPSKEELIQTSLGDGGATMGPRLLEVLSTIERDLALFPLEVRWDINKGRVDEFEATFSGSKVLFVELSITAYKAFIRHRRFVRASISHSQYVSEYLPKPSEEEAGTFSIQMNEGGGTSGETIKNLDYILIGNVAEGDVRDGDTVDIEILHIGPKVPLHESIKIGNKVGIRYVGIQTPETKKKDNSYGDSRNAEYALAYGITVPQAYLVADDGKTYTKKTLSQSKGYVVIDLDIDQNGNLVQTFDRFMGVVYKTRVTDMGLILKGQAGSVIHMNKSMLVEKSSQVSGVPLAMPYKYFINQSEYSRFDAALWEQQLGLKPRVSEDAEVGDTIKDVFKKPVENKQGIDYDFVEITHPDLMQSDNRINWFEPLDDRLEEIIEVEAYTVRIGDVKLTIPPTAIQVSYQSNIQKVKTLRSKSSMMTKVGSGVTKIALELYFHDLESINGYEVENEGGITYWMDGLRPLIAQFKKAPFVPIDNYYINEVLGVTDVALVDMNITTVPGFPHSLSAKLTLAKFDISAFMPQAVGLQNHINYPLLRWYYQEAMREPKIPNFRTYLAPVKGQLKNDFTFLEADEADLEYRQTAIQKLRTYQSTKQTPEDLERQVDDASTTLGKLIRDGRKAERVLAQYRRYKDAIAKKLYSVPGAGEPVLHPAKPDPRKPSKKESSGVYNAQAFWAYIYADQVQSNYDSEMHRAKHSDGIYIPFKSTTFTDGVSTEGSGDDQTNGVAQISLMAGPNAEMFHKKYKYDDPTQNVDKDAVMYRVTMNSDTITKLEKIVQNAKDAELSVQETVDEYKALEKIVNLTEGTIELFPVDIPNLLITGMNVLYENHFSSVQTRDADAPSLQYLGGQDPYVHITAEGDELSVIELTNMLKRADEYARRYRLGITSGFLGIDNQLTRLFGIEAVLPESVIVNTVKGFPGRFEIEMVLVGFNKTQRRTETLEGISPIYGDVVKHDRRVENNPEKGDTAIFEYRMRTLETYADLELPTYEEVNAALPKIGAQFYEYPNPGKSRFVDPDFYVATSWTFREDLKRIRDQEHKLEMKDMMGVNMYTSSKDVLLDGSSEDWNLLYEVDKKSGDPVNPLANWSEGVDYSPTGDADETYGADSATLAFINDRSLHSTPPTLQDYANWGMGRSWTEEVSVRGQGGRIIGEVAKASKSDYNAWLANPQPTPLQVYNYIYEKIDSLWGSEFFNDKSKDQDDKAWMTVCYSKGPGAIAKASYEHSNSEKPDGYMDMFVNGLEKGWEGLKETFGFGDEEGIKDSEWAAVKNKMPRERMANLMKAMFHNLSSWKQFSEGGKPYTAGLGAETRVGIARVHLAKHASSPEEAKRFMWDWKYGMDWAFEKMHDAYMEAKESEDTKISSIPWDWAIKAMDESDESADTLNTAFFRSVYSRFEQSYNAWFFRYGTAHSPVDSSVMSQVDKLSKDEMAVVQGNRSHLINELKAVGYEDWEDLKNTDKWSDQMVRDEYEKYMTSFFGITQDYYRSGVAQNPLMAAEAAKTGPRRNKYPEQWENWQRFFMARNTRVEAINALTNSNSPGDLFPDMLTDMIEYDHRGRLVRAFPTFQMFIIDEGRWMTNYRIWDNMYGYNGISSIDVHKDRRIAADTAVIQMTNMYSNLSSRPLDTKYGDHEFNIIDNLIFGNPSEALLDARKELLSGMFLQPGARIHLRVGYGSSVPHLPVVFNGTITEMNTDQVIEIVAQGDGLELTSVISGDPDDDNNRFGPGGVIEPRDLICQLMTSKGNWFKDAINWQSDGTFFKENPLGIQHFGSPDGTKTPPGNVFFYNTEYGEAAQNIYSSNGANTFSQWTYKDGSDIPFSWDGLVPKFQGGDELNIEMSLYNRTLWDVAQLIASCSPDYIAAVHPFELRSTLFFGKPYYRMAYKYDSKYDWNKDKKMWTRQLEAEVRKPYMQFHIFDGGVDVIKNGIKASSDGMFTNCIVQFEGGQTDIIYADWDIYNQYHRTNVVNAPLVGGDWNDFWTADNQALYYGYSTVRDSIKDMYKGELVVLGDPTIKPHDMCFLSDEISDMQGTFLVKAVTHHFSFETGFVTAIQPDALAVTDDLAIMSIGNWFRSMAVSAISGFLAVKLTAAATRKILKSPIAVSAVKHASPYADRYIKRALVKALRQFPKDDPDVMQYRAHLIQWLQSDDDAVKASALEKMDEAYKKMSSDAKMAEWESRGLFKKKGGKAKIKGLLSTAKAMRTATKGGKAAFMALRTVGTVAGLSNPLGWIALLGGTILTESIAEMYRRKKARYQCVLVMPMQHQGREFTAGINGHKGMVIGDAPGRSKLDSFLSGLGWDGENAETLGEWFTDPSEMIGDTLNFFMDPENSKDFNVDYDDLATYGNNKRT